MAQHDPLADLKAEIAAEEAALAGQETDTQAAELAAQKAEDERLAAEDVEKGDDEPDPDVVAQAEVEGKPDKKLKKGKESDEERMVPAARLNEYAVNNRKMAKQLEELQDKLKKLENPTKPGEKKQLTPEEYHEQIRNQARAEVRLEMQVEEFLEAGSSKYTQKTFDAACDKIASLIDGPNDLIAVAIEATGSPKAAADALYLLGQNDAPEIEAFLALSPIRKAAQLSKLATTRPSRAKQDDDPSFRPKRPKIEEDDEPPVPLRPIKGNSRIPEGLGDDVPDDVWNERFEKQIMNKGRQAAH